MRNEKRARGGSSRMTTASGAHAKSSSARSRPSGGRREGSSWPQRMDALPLGIEEDGLEDLHVAKPVGRRRVKPPADRAARPATSASAIERPQCGLQ